MMKNKGREGKEGIICHVLSNHSLTFLMDALACIGRQKEEISLFSGLLHTAGPFCGE